MKFEMTLDRLEEIALCIVQCQLSEDEACEYIKAVALESDSDSLYQEREIIEGEIK